MNSSVKRADKTVFLLLLLVVDCFGRNITDCEPDIACDDYNPRYRTANGACNNIEKPWLGMAQRKQARFLQPDYADGLGSPRNSTGLPSARTISNMLFSTGGINRFSSKHTVLSMGWGQFLCHDIAFTPEEEAPSNCCESANADEPNCFVMPIPEDDPYFNNTDCLHFVRSEAVNNICLNGTREQVNEVTSFIDGSMIYGSSDEQMANLRDPTGGTLKVTHNDLLPEDPSGICKHATAEAYCQKAGDIRVDEVPNLSLHHLAFVRIHNSIANKLKDINPSWTDEKTFQETRKIVGALIQHVTYNEYLPMIIGSRAVNIFRLQDKCGWPFVKSYDPDVDPTIRNGFIGAALRVGHTMIMPTVSYLSESYDVMYDADLSGQLFNTFMTLKENGSWIQPLARWLSYQPSMETDRYFQNEIRNRLFGHHDLPARNIQRGRDHGLPPYNTWRQWCGLEPVDFSDDPIVGHDQESSDIIKALYENADDIDLYAGGISEIPTGGGLMGPTFQCIFIRQFLLLKTGDSHWYERYRGNDGFTVKQLKSIKRISLSKLICDAFHLPIIQKQAFKKASLGNPMVSCSSLPKLDLSLWKSI